MNRWGLGIVIAILVMGSLGLGYLGGTTSQQTRVVTSIVTTVSISTIVTTKLIGSGCASPTNPTTTNGSIRVYEIGVGSTASLCVSFVYNGPGNDTFPVIFEKLNASGGAMCTCEGLSGSDSISFASIASPTNFTETYRVETTSAISPGVYWLYVSSCAVIDLVVGPLPPSLPSWETGPNSCYYRQVGWSSFVVIGTTNAAAADISTSY